MLLQCAGMIRSGSTLQYNIAKRVVEMTDTGEHIHANEDIWERCRIALDLPNKWLVNKSHVYQPTLLTKEYIQRGRIKVVMCYRDVRDVAASQMKFRRVKFEQVVTFLREQTIEREARWLENVPNCLILRVRYEDMHKHITGHALAIADHLGVDLTIEQAREIAAELDIEAVKKQTAQQNNMNAHTRFDQRHIHDGSHGRYRKVLRPSQIEMVENECGDWLQANGYILDSERMVI